MKRILIVGAGGIPGGLMRLIGPQISISTISQPVGSQLELAHYQTKQINDDCFSGGGRSKGEKKRAARERRLRGGY